MAASSAYIWLSVIITLVSGTFSAVANKALYQMHTDGLCGSNTFGKAYMTTLWMFIGEALCLIYFYCNKWYQQYKHAHKKRAPSTAVGGNNQPLLAPTEDEAEAEDGVAEAKKPPVWVFVILSLFDLSATATNGVGLVYITASTNQMLRGSAVLFTGIFSILILKRRLSLKKWLGIGIVIAGLGIVGGSAALQAKLDEQNGKASDDANAATPLQAVLGVILVLVGSALNSAQNVFEEKLLKATGSAEIDPLEVVGWEGVSGVVLSAFVLLPVTEAIPGGDCGTAESTTDSLIQMHNQPLIVGLLVLYAVCLAFMNYFSQVISKHLSAVHRMLVSTLRTVLVWVAGILLYYVFTHRSFGESWAVSSYMQLGGFACLIIGTFVYGMTAPEPAEKVASVTEAVMDLPSDQEDSMFSHPSGKEDNRL